MDDYMLKVYGLSEYFASDSVLANYSFGNLTLFTITLINL